MNTVAWILVFWLEHPANLAQHSEYQWERDCRDQQQLWQRRFDIVKSRLRAECRPKETEDGRHH